MHKSSATLMIAAFGALVVGGCSSSGNPFGDAFTTQSLQTQPPPATVAAAPKIDPACYGLQQRIDMLRKDGVTERIEKASVGKSSTVPVKRASLAQAAELDKANAEFQARCSTLGVRPMQAQLTPGAAPVANTSQVVPASAPPVIQQR
jgi:hypothetical protein